MHLIVGAYLNGKPYFYRDQRWKKLKREKKEMSELQKNLSERYVFLSKRIFAP